MSTHVFDEAVALRAEGGDRWRGSTHSSYANFIGPFGGMTAAQCINAVMQHLQRLGEPVAFTINFAAALADGEFTIDARPARTNRSTQHWMIEARQGDAVTAIATAVTAVRRDVWTGPSEPMPTAPRPGDVAAGDRRGRVEWINRYDMRFIAGGFPAQWSGGDTGDSRTLAWVRDDPPRPLDFVSLTALCDTFFPRIWLRRATFTPLGTVSMTIYFHAGQSHLDEAGTGYLLGQARAQAFHNGYFDQSAQLWTESGRLVATTHQVMYYKE